MKIQIIVVCACVVMSSASYIYHNRYPIEQYQQHASFFPGGIVNAYPTIHGENSGHRFKRGIYNYQYNRLRNNFKDNGLGQWGTQGFSSFGRGHFGRLGNLAATLSSGIYW